MALEGGLYRYGLDVVEEGGGAPPCPAGVGGAMSKGGEVWAAPPPPSCSTCARLADTSTAAKAASVTPRRAASGRSTWRVTRRSRAALLEAGRRGPPAAALARGRGALRADAEGGPPAGREGPSTGSHSALRCPPRTLRNARRARSDAGGAFQHARGPSSASTSRVLASGTKVSLVAATCASPPPSSSAASGGSRAASTVVSSALGRISRLPSPGLRCGGRFRDASTLAGVLAKRCRAAASARRARRPAECCATASPGMTDVGAPACSLGECPGVSSWLVPSTVKVPASLARTAMPTTQGGGGGLASQWGGRQTLRLVCSCASFAFSRRCIVCGGSVRAHTAACVAATISCSATVMLKVRRIQGMVTS